MYNYNQWLLVLSSVATRREIYTKLRY